MNKLLKIGIFLIGIFGFFPRLYSQSITDSIFYIHEVQVYAKTALEERGLVKTHIDNSIIKTNSFSDLASILSNYSSLFIKSYGQGSLATVSFRGTAASHTRVDWNGINLNNPMPGQVDFSLIPMFIVDEISLYHGGSSLYEGSGALGGSVYLKSMPKWDRKLYGSLNQSVGSFGSYNTSMDLGGGKQDFQMRLRVYRESSKNDFEFFNTKNGEFNNQIQKNANYKKSGFLNEIHLRKAKNNVFSLYTWWQLAERNFAPLMSMSQSRKSESQKDDDLRFSFIWKKYGNKLKLETNLGLSYSGILYHSADTTFNSLVVPHYDSQSDIISYNAKNKLEYKFNSDFILRNILDFSFSDVSNYDRVWQTGYEETRAVLGNTLSIHKYFNQNFSAFALLRTELSDWGTIPLMPSFGIDLKLDEDEDIYLKFNLSRNYHLPSLNDLYWLPGGNSDLKPEEGYSGDMSFDFDKQVNEFFGVHTSFTAFYSIIDNWILWRPGDFSYWTAENIKKVRSQGFEYKLKTNYQTETLKFQGLINYSYTRSTNLEDSDDVGETIGKQLIYVPVNKLNAFFKMNLRKNSISYNYGFTGKRYTTSSNEEQRGALPAYGLHSLTFGKEIAVKDIKLNFNFKVKNLLNTDYEAVLDRAMPGRSLGLNCKITF